MCGRFYFTVAKPPCLKGETERSEEGDCNCEASTFPVEVKLLPFSTEAVIKLFIQIFTRNIMKRTFAFILAVVSALVLMCGCTAEKEKPALELIKNHTTFDEWMNNAKIKSLTNLGNTQRLKAAIEKAKSGEEVTIAYLGGSITEGDHKPTCYAERSYRNFVEAFAKKGEEQIKYVNAGISGTPSKLGALRLEKDILSSNPDIVFIEYACNDGGEQDDFDAFESLILDCLEYESKPAVILLFARGDTGWSSQDWKKEIGFYHNISMISYADGITYLLDNGAMQWSDFSNDYCHPHEEGNAIVAEFIKYFYDEVDRLPAQGDEAVDYAKEPKYDGFFRHAKMLEKTNYDPVDLGSWRKGSDGFHYADGWKKDYSDNNEPIVFEFTGRHAYMVYPQSGNDSFGTVIADVYFNGELVATKEINEYQSGGWMAPIVFNLHRSPTEGDYRVEFRAKDGEARKDMQVLAVAYTVK